MPEKRGKTFSPHRYSSSLNTLTNGTDGRANFLANVCLVSESELANVVSSQLALTDANPNPTVTPTHCLYSLPPHEQVGHNVIRPLVQNVADNKIRLNGTQAWRMRAAAARLAASRFVDQTLLPAWH